MIGAQEAAGPPKPSLTRFILPSRRGKYVFESPDLPVDWEGEGVLHTKGTRWNGERAVNAQLELDGQHDGSSVSVNHLLFINTSAGYDVRNEFNIAWEDRRGEEPVRLADATRFHPYLTDASLQEVPEEDADSEAVFLQYFDDDGDVLDGEVMDGPFRADIESANKYGAAFGPIMGDPLVDGYIEAQQDGDGLQVSAELEGTTMHYGTGLEARLDEMMTALGMDYEHVFRQE